MDCLTKDQKRELFSEIIKKGNSKLSTDIRIIDFIDKGASGVVSRVTLDSKEFALKSIFLDDDYEENFMDGIIQCFSEYEMLSKGYPHVVKSHDYFFDNKKALLWI